MDAPIADLHCHYPMRLPEAVNESDRSVRGVPFAGMRSFDRRSRAVCACGRRGSTGCAPGFLRRAAEKLNYPGHGNGSQPSEPDWRVSLERLRRGDVRFVFSVL